MKQGKGVIYQTKGVERGQLQALAQIAQAVQQQFTAALKLIAVREGLDAPMAFNTELMAFVAVPVAVGSGPKL